MRKRVLLLLLAAALALRALVVSCVYCGVWPPDARAALGHLQGLGALGPVFFVAAYVVACVLFVPGAVFTFGAGALFGVLRGTVYASLGSILGATCAFLIGRYLAHDWVEGKMRENKKFAAISAAISRDGWKIVGLLRLSPLFPFNLLNYAFGITQVSLRDYVLASWIAMLPGTALYVYLGSLAGSLAGFDPRGHAKTPGEWGLYALGLAATAAASLYVAHVARAALRSGMVQGGAAGTKTQGRME